MTATVYDLAAQRHLRERVTSSCNCREDFTCYPHRIADAVDRLEALSHLAEDELLVPADLVTETAAAVLPSLKAIVRECLGPTERQAR